MIVRALRSLRQRDFLIRQVGIVESAVWLFEQVDDRLFENELSDFEAAAK